MAVIVSNGLLVTFDDEARLIEKGAIRLENGIVTAVGPTTEIVVEVGDTVIDAADCLILPGFTNAHSHSPEVWGRGRADGMKLEPWLDLIFSPLDTLPPSALRIAILLTSAEMLKSGVTTVVDHFRQTPMRQDAIEAAVAAYGETGLNAAIAIMLRDRPVCGDAIGKNPASYSVTTLRALAETAIRSWHEPRGRISIMLGPSAPHRCSDDLLESVGELSRRYDVMIHTHIDETVSQRRQADALYGCSTVHHLAEIGLLGPNISIAHAVWIDESDMDLIAESGSWVVHNPISNARLGSGIAPLADLLRRGISVALGTDGAASNDSQNLLEVMKMAALLSALRNDGHAAPPTAFEIARMATRMGGRLAGGNRGSLAVGMQADVIVVEGQDAPFRPLNNIYRQLVYAGARLQVKHVIIGGRLVLENGRISSFDELQVYREAQEMRGSIYQ